jgi:hypothetical protein
VVPKFQLRAQPWWVNLLWVVPWLAFAIWRRKRLSLSWFQLTMAGVFAIAFGFVEAAVVVYLRAAVGLLPGYHGTLADVQHLAGDTYQQAQSISEFPQSLLTLEVFREAATMVMLLAVSLLAAARSRERWAIFVWTFALWDAAYYGGLWFTIRWPSSLKESDVLFLIPQPWISQVWFPLAVSGLCLLAVLLCRRKPGLAERPAARIRTSMS